MQTEINLKTAYADLYPSVNASATESGGESSSKLGTGLSVNQSLYSPGLFSDIKLKKNSTEAARLDQEALEAEIRTSVETAYYDILASQSLLNVFHENLMTADENLQMIQTMYKLGTKTESDVLKAEVQKGTIENQLIGEELDLIKQKRSLAILMGRSPDQDFAIEEIDIDQINIPDLAEARSLLLKNSPEYQSMLKSLKGEQISLQVAKEAYLPSLSAGYNYSKTWTGATSSNGSGAWNISANIGLFDGFSKKQNVQKSKLNVKSAEIGLQAKEQELLSTLLTYYSSLDNYNKVIALQEKTLESARKNYELVTRQYELGMATMLEQTTAQVSVLEAQTDLVKAKYSRKIVESQIRQLLAL
jgi:outer membrane protein